MTPHKASRICPLPAASWESTRGAMERKGQGPRLFVGLPPANDVLASLRPPEAALQPPMAVSPSYRPGAVQEGGAVGMGVTAAPPAAPSPCGSRDPPRTLSPEPWASWPLVWRKPSLRSPCLMPRPPRTRPGPPRTAYDRVLPSQPPRLQAPHRQPARPATVCPPPSAHQQGLGAHLRAARPGPSLLAHAHLTLPPPARPCPGPAPGPTPQAARKAPGLLSRPAQRTHQGAEAKRHGDRHPALNILVLSSCRGHRALVSFERHQSPSPRDLCLCSQQPTSLRLIPRTKSRESWVPTRDPASHITTPQEPETRQDRAAWGAPLRPAPQSLQTLPSPSTWPAYFDPNACQASRPIRCSQAQAWHCHPR